MTLPVHEPVVIDAQGMRNLLLAANAALDAAREVTLHYFRRPVDIDNKAVDGLFDPVTIADREAELAIRDVLGHAFSEIGFLGEEFAPQMVDSELIWVVDPIDGTRAFVSGMPMWGTLIGLYNGRNAVLGVMDQPVLGERLIAADGIPATLQRRNDKLSASELKTRSTATVDAATLYCTTPDMFTDPRSRSAFERVRDTSRLVRYGGDCYAYALLAMGFVDIVLDCDLKPFDIIALIPIIEQAGGSVTDWHGGSAVNGGMVVATGNEVLHLQVLELLNNNVNQT